MQERQKTIVKAEKIKAESLGVILAPTLIYVLNGSASMLLNGEETAVPADSFIILSYVDKVRDITFTDDARYYKIVLDRKGIRDFPSPLLASVLRFRPDGFKNIVDCSDNAIIKVIFGKIAEEFAEHRLLKEESLDNSLTQLLIELYRRSFHIEDTKHLSLVDEVMNYIEEHFKDELTIEELGGKFYLDRFYLSHIFRDYTGFTLKQYLTMMRLNYARELLINDNLTVNEICNAIGFSDINNFIRYFKKEYVFTPLCYRKEYKVIKNTDQ